MRKLQTKKARQRMTRDVVTRVTVQTHEIRPGDKIVGYAGGPHAWLDGPRTVARRTTAGPDDKIGIAFANDEVIYMPRDTQIRIIREGWE